MVLGDLPTTRAAATHFQAEAAMFETQPSKENEEDLFVATANLLLEATRLYKELKERHDNK